jgi:hypothetical protein
MITVMSECLSELVGFWTLSIVRYSNSIPDEVIGFFSIDLILPAGLGPEVYSAPNRNEYQELIK